MKYLSKLWRFAKVVVFPALVVGVPYAAQGHLGPEAQQYAAAIIAVWALFSRRPQDVHPAETK